MDNRHITGKYGEQIAKEFLIKNKYKIIEQNYKNHYGEIDIIAKYKKEIIFIEVKTRTNYKYGRPIQAIDKYKLQHIINTAKYYLYKQKIRDMFVRFDCIEVYLGKKIKINHVKQIV